MKYNTQDDPHWSGEVITECHQDGRDWKDTIGLTWYKGTQQYGYGCVITALSNIFQVHLGHEWTPKRTNDMLRQHKGYRFLRNPDCHENEASFIEWDVLENLLNIKVVKYLKVKDYERMEDCYYIARIENTFGGHYVNVLFQDIHNRLWCFDVGIEQIRDYTKQITFLHRIEF